MEIVKQVKLIVAVYAVVVLGSFSPDALASQASAPRISGVPSAISQEVNESLSGFKAGATIASLAPAWFLNTIRVVGDIKSGKVPQGWEDWGRRAQGALVLGLMLGSAPAAYTAAYTVVPVITKNIREIAVLSLITGGLWATKSIINAALDKEKKELTEQSQLLLAKISALEKRSKEQEALHQRASYEPHLMRPDIRARAVALVPENFYTMQRMRLDQLYRQLHNNEAMRLRLINIVAYSATNRIAHFLRNILVALMSDPQNNLVLIQDLLAALTPEYLQTRSIPLDKHVSDEAWKALWDALEENAKSKLVFVSREINRYEKDAAVVKSWGAIIKEIHAKLGSTDEKESQYIAVRVFEELFKRGHPEQSVVPSSSGRSSVRVEIVGEEESEEEDLPWQMAAPQQSMTQEEAKTEAEEKAKEEALREFDQPIAHETWQQKIANAIVGEINAQRKLKHDRLRREFLNTPKPPLLLPPAPPPQEQEKPSGWWQWTKSLVGY